MQFHIFIIELQYQQSVMDRVKIIIEQLLQELVYPGTNISTIPITILTTILYTSKKKIFLNHNTALYWYTILEQIFIPVLCTILVYQYCDRQVQEIQDYH